MGFTKKNGLQLLSFVVIAGITWHFASNADEYGPWIVRPVMIILFIALIGTEAWIDKNVK
jgi:hypothetical protein